MRHFLHRLQRLLLRLVRSAAPLFSLDIPFLLLLSASFGYSLFSLIIHIVDRQADEETTAQISPDGKSLLQLRKTGLAIFDVETGKLKDELRLVSRWRNAFLPPHKRTDLWTRGDAYELPFRETTTLQISSSAQFVIVRCLDDTLLWWNRAAQEHRFIESSGFFWSDITLDEPRDRFYVKTLRGYNTSTEDSAKAEMNGRYEPFAFNQIRDLHVFELSTGKELKTFQSLMIGQPVRGHPELRLRAQDDAIELLRWPNFPEGEPTVEKKFPLDAKDWELSQVKTSVPPIIRLKENNLILETILSPHRIFNTDEDENRPCQVRTLRLGQGGASISTRNLHSSLTQVEIFDQLEGYAASDYYGRDGQSSWRLEWVAGDKRALLSDSPHSPLQFLRADYGLSAAKLLDEKIRLARDDGVIFDIDLNAPEKTTAWKIPLLPHTQIPRDAIAIFLLGALAWLAYAFKRRCLFAKQGWIVLIAIAAWPLILWSLERGFTNDRIAIFMQLAAFAIASIPLLACTLGLFLSTGRSRAIVLTPWIILALLAAGAPQSLSERENASVLDHFGIRLDWRQ